MTNTKHPMSMDEMAALEDLEIEGFIEEDNLFINNPRSIRMVEGQAELDFECLRINEDISVLLIHAPHGAQARWWPKKVGQPWRYSPDWGKTWKPCSRLEAWNWLINRIDPYPTEASGSVLETVTNALRIHALQQQTFHGELGIDLERRPFDTCTFAQAFKKGMEWFSTIEDPRENTYISIENHKNDNVVMYDPQKDVWRVCHTKTKHFMPLTMLEALEYLLENKYPNRQFA
jgi:hypothetical protein